MLELVRTVDFEEINSVELRKFLDDHFHPELAPPEGSLNINGKHLSEKASQQRWGDDFTKGLPRKNHELLFQITQATTAYHMQNCVGRLCQKYVWREFFRVFPLGRIMLIHLPIEWLIQIWAGERALASEMGLASVNPLATPQGMSGLQAENFPFNTMLLGANGIYPLTLFDFVHTSSDLVFVYVPDRAVVHTQMLETGAYSGLLWRLHHILDDQWTFDGSRGPKSAASETAMNPVENIEYFAWFFTKIGERMSDILSISSPLRREQICMTFSRAVCDCVLSISAQLPYMAKAFFFACLDKLSNLSVLLGHHDSDTEAWYCLTSNSFLSGSLASFLESVPGPAGSYFRGIVEWAADNMEMDRVTPEVLRDIRNSHHGYALRQEIVSRLFASSGEMNNDVTLLCTPLVLYLLAEKWA